MSEGLEMNLNKHVPSSGLASRLNGRAVSRWRPAFGVVLALAALIAPMLWQAAQAQQRVILNKDFVQRMTRAGAPLPDYQGTQAQLGATGTFCSGAGGTSCLIYIADARCLVPTGSPEQTRGCVVGWMNTDPYDGWLASVANGHVKSPVQIARGASVEALDLTNGGAELNAHNPGRLFQNVCLAANESIPFSYVLGDPNSTGAAASQARFGIFANSGANAFVFPGTPISIVNSTSVQAGAVLQSGSVTAPATGGIYQIGFESILPATGAVGNYISSVSITLKPLIDAGPAGTQDSTFFAPVGSTVMHTLLVRVNGQVPAGGMTIPLTLGGTLPESGYQFGTPSAIDVDFNVIPGASLSGTGANRLLFIPPGNYDANTHGNGSISNPSGVVVLPIEFVDDNQTAPTLNLTVTVGPPGTGGSTGGSSWGLDDPRCDGTFGETVAYTLNASPMPRLSKTFVPDTMPYGGVATMTFVIDNTAPDAVDRTVGFTDNLAVGLQIADPANAASTCGGTVAATPGGNQIVVSGANVLAGQTCTVTVGVTNRPGFSGICYNPNFANENQNLAGLQNLIAQITQFTCVSVTPPDCPDADYTNGFGNISGLSPNLNNGVSGQCLALLPTITLNKISEAGTGSFGFTFGNTDATNPVTIVTTAPSLPAAAGPFNVLDLAQPVTIAETGLPAGWTLTSITCVTEGGDPIGSFDTGTATWTVGPDELASGQEISCTAVNLAPPAEVDIIKTLTAESGGVPGFAEPGEQLTYAITLNNTGGGNAIDYAITDVLDPNVTFVSADNGGSLVGSDVEWSGLTVPAGGNLVLTVVVQVVDPIPAGVTEIGNVAYDPTDPPPDCEATPMPPNCTQVPVIRLPLACPVEQTRATERWWFFGNRAGIDFGISGTTATAILNPQTISTAEGSTVVTDVSGQLLFWSNANTAYNRNHMPMPNGTGLQGNNSATQTVAAFPALGSPGRYFIVTTSTDVGTAANGQLRYSVVDMNLNGGLGDIVAGQKNIPLGGASTASEALTAIPNADGTGFWVLTYTNNSPNLLAYQFDSSGPVGGPITTVLSTNNGNFYGSLYFSKQLDALVQATGTNGLAGQVRLLHFDAATGVAHERFTWTAATLNAAATSRVYSADFSPDGDYIYLSRIFGGGRLYRYRIEGAASAADVIASMQFVGNTSTVQGGHVRRGTDGRMYVPGNINGTSLNVVNAPDDPIDPGFVANGFALAAGAGTTFGLPQMVTGCPAPVPDPIDFGDAPDSYGTLLASDGARHIVPDLDLGTNTAALMLGTTIDTETDAVPDASAQGDDADFSDDENAVGAMPDIGVTQTTYSVTLTVRNTTGATADLVGWVDWNRNGVFDSTEAATTSVADGATSAALSWTGVSAGPLVGTTFARLRIAPAGELDASTPTGEASAGEVEDHVVRIVELPDTFGSCPVNELPPPTNFTIQERWRTPNTAGLRTLPYQTPVVGDLFGTGEIVAVVASDDNFIGNTAQPANTASGLRIVRGSNGAVIGTIATPRFNWFGHSVVAIADADGDGVGEVFMKAAHNDEVAAANRGRLFAYKYNGTAWNQWWMSDVRYDYNNDSANTGNTRRSGHSLSIADFNGDGVPEIFIGNQVFNARTGVRLVSRPATDPAGCVLASCIQGSTVAADMDGDGVLELIAGNVVYKVNITNPNAAAGNTITIWQQADAATSMGDGFTAVADIDLDGDPDVVIVRSSGGTGDINAHLFVWDGQTGTVLGAVHQAQLGTQGSQPMVGDIDGDGIPEIVFVTVNRLNAYKYVAGTGLVQKWQTTTNDASGQTSFALFDFNNDGHKELVYRDETNLRIINGSGAAAVDVATFPCFSGTRAEMPVVAALDGNREARILVTCSTTNTPDFNARGSLRAYQTASFPWANTRPVWNQQAYFVTHVNNDLTIPAQQFPHWTAFSDPAQVCSDGINRPLNAFQQQVTDLDPNTGCSAVCATANVDTDKALVGESGTQPGIAEPGEQLTYTITLTNSGGLNATDQNVIDLLDANVIFVSADNGGVLNGGQIEWTGLTVPAAGNLVLTVVVQVVDPIPDGVISIGNVAYDPDIGPPDCTSDPLPSNCTVTPTPDPLDFGDAPNSYGTLLASGGARHVLAGYDHVTDTTPLMLGALVDQETDGFPGAAASGDDNAAIDDEDAFFGPIALQPGATTVSLDVPVINTTGGDAQLYAWIDFNRNGVFNATEAGNCPVVADAATQVTCTWSGLTPLLDGSETHARFRLTTQTLTAGTAPNGGDARAQGLAADGEVEDHRVTVATILPLTCEAPFVETFGTYAAAPGAFPGWGTSLPAGTTTYAFQPGSATPVNTVGGGQYARMTNPRLSHATAWQNASDHTPGDTDGFMLVVNASPAPGVFYRRTFSGLTVGARYSFFASLANIVAGVGAGLPNVTLRIVDPATNAVLASFNTGGIPEDPAGAMTWHGHQLIFVATQADVRVELANNSGVQGGNDLALDDIGFAQVCELGDAPDSYATLNASNGAGHLFPGAGLSLGSGQPDGEVDGQPTVDADGDDVNGNDDEDAFPSGAPSVVIAAPYALSVPVETTAGDATACAWLDLDQNGSFSAAEGQCQPLTAGATTAGFTWSGPATAGLVSGQAYLRLRIERNGSFPANLSTADFLGPRGPGEVEDYIVTVLTPAEVAIAKALIGENGTLSGIAEAGEQLTYTITLTNAGGVPATGYAITDQLDPNVAFVSADNGGTLVGTQVQWTGLTVPANGTLVLTVVVEVVDPIPAGVTEIGNVAYDPTDPPPDCDATPTPPNCTVTPTEPNVSTVKTLTGESGTLTGIAEPGEQLTYSITLNNGGGTDAINYSQVDQLDPNVIFVSADNGGTQVGTQVQWTGLTVPANGSLVLTIVVQVVDPIPEGVLSIGNVAYDPTEPPPDCEITPTPPNCTVTPTPPQLDVQKSIIAESLLLDGIAEPGEELTYSIRVRNTGGTDALNRIVNEIVPANTAYVAIGSDAWSCADGSGPGTPCDFSVATVPANGFVDLLFRVRIDDPIPLGVAQIANAVALDGEIPPTCPPNAGNPQDPGCAVIPTVPQTVVAKALTGESLGQNGQAEAGEVLTYTITVTNHGGTDDTNVVVNEIVPDYTATAPGNQSVNGALGNWSCADLSGPGAACNLTLALVPSGGSVTLEFRVRVDDPIPDGITQIANSVALDGVPPPPCPPAGGQCVVTPTEASVSVVKTLLLEDGEQAGVAEAGETLVYQLTVTNSGGSAALAEFLREIVPEHSTFVADPVSSPGWTCADGSPNPTVCDLTFDIGPLQTLDFVFAVEVVDPIPDGVREIANGIGLSGNPPPCPPGGVHCVVAPTANLATDKTVVSVTPVGANSYRVIYQIVMANTGGAPATYTLSDQLSYPASGVTLLNPAVASTDDGVLEPTLAANSGQFTPINDTPVQLSDIDVPLAVGESHTYVVALAIAVDPALVSNGTCTGAPGNGLYNSAVAVGTADADDVACVPVPAGAPSVALVKTNRLLDGNGNGYGDAGEPVEYTFLISNNGGLPLSSLRLLDAKIRAPQGAWVACDRPGTPGSGSYAFSTPLQAGEQIACTATLTLTAGDIANRRVTNTANVVGIASDGRTVRASHTAIFENFQ